MPGNQRPAHIGGKAWSIETAMQFTIAFNIERGGVRVQPEFPHVMEACAYDELIPFARLVPIAKQNGVLARVAK